MSDLAFRRFRNALCLLRAIDPCRFFLTIGSSRAEPLFGLIEARQPPELRERVTA